MKKVLISLGFILLASVKSYAGAVGIIPTSAIVISSAPALANAIATVTISSPTGGGAYSSGLYNYISDVHAIAYATGTVSGVSSPISCTMTGLPVSLTLYFETAMNIGTIHPRDFAFSAPLQSNQGAQVVISCPATGGVLWNLQATYFVGP